MSDGPEPTAIQGLRRSAQGRTAIAMTLLLGATLAVLLLTVPAVGRLALLSWACVAAVLWWVTGGSKPWIWPYSGRRTGSSWLRLMYCVLQLSRSVGRLLLALVAVAAAVVVVAIVVGALTLLFDLAANGHVHLSGYAEFFADDLPRWLSFAFHGHLGTKDAN